MRIVHISDLHADATEFDQAELVTAALADIAALDRDVPVDIVVFSGDLAFDGSRAGLNRGKELLLDPLRSQLAGRPIIIVPGNHDVDRRKIGPIVEAGLSSSLVDRTAVVDLFTNSVEVDQALARLEDWFEFESGWDTGLERLPTGDTLSRAFLGEVGGVTCGIAALNSAWRCQGGEDDKGKLLLGELQLRESLMAIDRAEVRIAVLHHPLEWLADFDSSFARAQLDGSGLFLLTGHEHTADPTGEMSTRGATLHSRAGCLYESLSYSNSYTVLDLDTERHHVAVTVRRWWPEMREYDAATDLGRGGRFTLRWPDRANALPVSRAELTDVVRPLVEIVQQQSVLIEPGFDQNLGSTNDLLVEPRFLAAPYSSTEVTGDAASATRTKIDPVETLDRSRVLIVSGPAFSGVTASLLWLLERHYRLRGTHAPAYVQIDSRMSLGRMRDAVELGLARTNASPGSNVLLAIDDTAPEDGRALGRLIRFLREYPNVVTVIGTHGDAHGVVADALRKHHIAHERAFLGPFGRRELRHVVAKLTGSESAEMVQRVLRTIHSQKLPRNPLNMAALVTVLAREPDLTTINESGLLQSYVNVLLDNPVFVDPDGLTMDYRRREHLLEKLAELLVSENRTRVARHEIERFVLDYFAEVGWRPGSAGHLVDSLIRRRVLVEDRSGVGFRYPALLNLFAAKLTLEDPAFREQVRATPLELPEIIKHSAGLRRNDRDLLAQINDLVDAAIVDISSIAAADQFDLIRDEHGWSSVSDLDEVRALLGQTPAPPTEAELDEIYEEVADAQPEESPTAVVSPANLEATPLDRLEACATLLAWILQNSELVPDVALKTRAVKAVISAWSVGTVILSVKEDEAGILRQLFIDLLADEKSTAGPPDAPETDETVQSLAEHVSRIFVVAIMSFGLSRDLGASHLQTVFQRVLDDDDFMGVTAQALFTTLLYFALRLQGSASRLRALYDRHGRHPIVRELVRQSVLSRYQEPRDTRDDDQLEDLIAEVLMPETAPLAGPGRAAVKSQVLADVRKTRLLERGSETKEYDELDDM